MTLWQVEEVIKLINNYRELECLWNYKSEYYKRVDVKRKAWLQLSKESGRDIAEIKKKIKHLRTAYVVEKKKVDRKKKTGTLTEIAYQPHLFYYDYLKFLEPFIILRRTSSDYSADNLESTAEVVEIAENSLSDSLCLEEEPPQRTKQKRISSPPPSSRSLKSQSQSQSPFSIPRSRKRKALEMHDEDDKFDNAIDRILNIAEGEEDNVHSAFSKSIAIQLKQLTPLEAAQVLGEIQQLVSRKLVESLQAKNESSAANSANNQLYAGSTRNTNRASIEESENHCRCGDIENNNEFEVYTKSWASELQKMSSVQRIYAKREIAEIICQGQLGSLNAESSRRKHFEKDSYMEKETGKFPLLEIDKENPEYIIS